jgi:hypothetical protein
MDHKERTMLAIRHQSPDRVPVDWTARTEVSDALIQHLGVRDVDALLQYLDVDLRYIQPIEVIYDRKRYSGLHWRHGRMEAGKIFGGATPRCLGVYRHLR